MFSNKTILITGGTGAIGQYLVEKLLYTEAKKIIIFSRDEDKQFKMQHKYSDDRLVYIIGDIRNRQQMDCALYGVDYVIHAAANKQVPIAERNPVEAVFTNVIGTYNVILSSINHNVQKVVYISSDKAISPTNCMGMTKGISERIIKSDIYSKGNTDIVGVRLGNVLGTRGSVIPLWKNQIKMNGKITLTDKKMTRFVMTTEDVYNLIVHAIDKGRSGEIIFLDMNVCNIFDIAKCICSYYGLDSENDIILLGPRRGEKFYEELFSEEERSYIYSIGSYYHIGTNKRNDSFDIPCKSCDLKLLSISEIKKILVNNQIISGR